MHHTPDVPIDSFWLKTIPPLAMCGNGPSSPVQARVVDGGQLVCHAAGIDPRQTLLPDVDCLPIHILVRMAHSPAP